MDFTQVIALEFYNLPHFMRARSFHEIDHSGTFTQRLFVLVDQHHVHCRHSGKYGYATWASRLDGQKVIPYFGSVEFWQHDASEKEKGE